MCWGVGRGKGGQGEEARTECELFSAVVLEILPFACCNAPLCSRGQSAIKKAEKLGGVRNTAVCSTATVLAELCFCPLCVSYTS